MNGVIKITIHWFYFGANRLLNAPKGRHHLEISLQFKKKHTHTSSSTVLTCLWSIVKFFFFFYIVQVVNCENISLLAALTWNVFNWWILQINWFTTLRNNTWVQLWLWQLHILAFQFTLSHWKWLISTRNICQRWASTL